MTVQVQFIRFATDGTPIILDSVSYPLVDIESAKAKALSMMTEMAERNAHIEVARIVDRYGSELHSFRIRRANANGGP